jgi:hypothetical protein
MAVKTIPDGCQSVTPYLIVKGADRAIDFYRKVFGAVQHMRMDGPNGTVGHAEMEMMVQRSCWQTSSRTWAIVARNRLAELA